MLPYDINTHLGIWVENLAYIGVGFCFGYILENAGFGSSRKLTAQFYLRDMTVLKVMFTGIVVAMLLIFWAGALGWADLGRLYVNPGYLASGILGGLLLGAGFIIGGFCPGTALVAAGTLKLDGLAFLGGVLGGIFIFGETAPLFWGFYQQAGAIGPYTLADLLHLPPGVVALLVMLLALGAFSAAEHTEAWMARRAAGAAGRSAGAAGARLAGAALEPGEVK